MGPDARLVSPGSAALDPRGMCLSWSVQRRWGREDLMSLQVFCPRKAVFQGITWGRICKLRERNRLALAAVEGVFQTMRSVLNRPFYRPCARC